MAKTLRGKADLLHGPVLQNMLRFALPILAGTLLQQLYSMVDAVVVGQFVGKTALAAVGGSAVAIINLLLNFFVGLCSGAAIVVAQYYGAHDHENVSRAVHTATLLAVWVGAIMTVIGVCFAPGLLSALDTPEDTMQYSIDYMRWYFAGMIPTMIYNMGSSILRAMGDSKRPLYYLIISSLTNIVLDLLFIGGFGWGVWAAAVATTISQAVSMVLCLIHLMKKGTIYQLKPKELRIDGEMLGQIVRYGLPSGVQNSVIGFANVIVQSNINSFGKVAMAAYGAYSKLEGFAFLPVTSFTMALTTFVGQNLGAGLHDRAKQGSRFGIIASVVIAELIGVTMYLLAPQLVAFFSPTPDVIALGTRQMRTTALFFCLLAYSHAVASICRGAGKAFVPMVIMLLFWCVVRITYITIVMRIIHEIQYIYMAYPITWSLSSIVYFLYYHFSDWVHGFDKQPKKI